MSFSTVPSAAKQSHILSILFFSKSVKSTLLSEDCSCLGSNIRHTVSRPVQPSERTSLYGLNVSFNVGCEKLFPRTECGCPLQNLISIVILNLFTLYN